MKQLNFISKFWQISCLPSANKSFWLFQVFWKRKWDGLWGNGLRPRRRSSLWPINLDWCDKKKKKDNKWDQWFRLRRSAPLLKMLMTRKKWIGKISRLCLLNVRVILHAELLLFGQSDSKLSDQFKWKRVCVATLGIQFLSFLLKLDLKDNPPSHFLLFLPD